LAESEDELRREAPQLIFWLCYTQSRSIQ